MTGLVLCFAFTRGDSGAPAGREINAEREGGSERDRQRESMASVFASNGPLWMPVCVRECVSACVCVCGRTGARVLAPQNDGGLGPGLMRCFRDNARRRVDM